MANVLKYPNDYLRIKTARVENFGPSLSHQGSLLYKMMIQENGAGLAATQIGINKRMFTIHNKLMSHGTIVNPIWRPAERSRKFLAKEGCLSFPGLFVSIKRVDKITVQYQNIHGKIFIKDIDGFAAHVFQHESDHLDGILMIDYLTRNDFKQED